MKLEEVILRGTRGAQPAATAVAAGSLYFVTDELLIERSTGAAWESYSVSGGPRYVVASSDESVTSNTTPQNDDALLFSADASAVYVIDVYANFTASTDNGIDVTMSWSIPASATITWSAQGYPATATTINEARHYTRYRAVTATGAGVLSTATIDASPVHVTAILRTAGTAGTVNFQFAQGTSSGTAVVRKADSYLKYQKVS